MKVKDLKKFLDTFDDEEEVLAEEKITGEVMSFETLMELWDTGNAPVFGLR